MNQKDEIQKRKEFLNKVYELTDGNTLNRIFRSELSEKLGFSKESFMRIERFILDEGLISLPVYRKIGITNAGIKQIENDIKNETIKGENRNITVNIGDTININAGHDATLVKDRARVNTMRDCQAGIVGDNADIGGGANWSK